MSLYDNVYEIMKDAVDRGQAAGVSALVLQKGEEKLFCAYGYRDAENKTPMTRDTILRLYSMTKPVTAAAAVLLISRGIIDAAAPVSDYLEGYDEFYVNRNGSRKKAVRTMTVRDLLNMTSGLAYPDENTEGGRQSGAMFDIIARRLYSNSPVTTMEFAEMASKLDLCFEPSSEFMYGISADVMGALIERVSEMSFGEFLRKEFFEPLEMHDTDFYVPEEKADRLAKVYDYSSQGLKETITDHLGMRYSRNIPPVFESGGAGLCSTVEDYSHFGQMLMDMGSYKGRQLLSPQAVKFLTKGGLSPQLMPQLQQGWDWMSGYTYGNFMRVCQDGEQVSLFSSKGEYGWDGWLGTFFSNEPRHGITYVFGVQQFCMGDTGTIARKIKNAVMDELAEV